MRFGRKIMPECVLVIFFMKNAQNALWASLTHSLFARTGCGQFETEKIPSQVLATILKYAKSPQPVLHISCHTNKTQTTHQHTDNITITHQQPTNIPTTHQ